MKVLCTADVHLGRVSSRLGGTEGAHSAREAWERIAELALREKVDALAVAGDLIDAQNRYFEAFGPVEKQLRRLADAGIECFLTAGNHDAELLPRFFDQFSHERVHFLGRGARWQSASLVRDGKPRLRVDGWSFPKPQHGADPLTDYPRQGSPGCPVLGLLHGDMDQPQSPYAPCRSADLPREAGQFWLLGHVHASKRFESAAAGLAGLYPGSPQALDPGESGWHGVWIAQWEGQGQPTLSQVGLSSVRYEDVEVPMDGATAENAMEMAIHQQLDDQFHKIAPEAGALRLLSCRMRLTGRTRLHRSLAAYDFSEFQTLRRSAPGGRFDAQIERVLVETRPHHDLEELAKSDNPPGILAKLLLALESGADHPLLARAQGELGRSFAALRVEGDNEQREGPADPRRQTPGEARTRSLLLEQGRRLLSELLEGGA